MEIPSFMRWKLVPRDVGWTFHAPYWKTDLPYANVDDDSLGIRDIYLARLPFSDYDRVVNYAFKLSSEMWGVNGIEKAFVLNHDEDYDDPGDGALADSLANDLMTLVPANGSISMLKMSEITGDVNIEVADALNAEKPNFLCGRSPISHELFIFNMIDLTITPKWDMSLLDYIVSFCDWQSCGGAGFWRNGNPDEVQGLPTEWLGAWNIGAVNIKGYGDGTWQHVVDQEDRYFLEEIAMNPDQPACVASTNASNRLRTDYCDKQDYLEVDESKYFLGNPVTPIAKLNIATEVADKSFKWKNTLAQNYPNPFNPNTTIKYSIKERSHVSLRIYNVLGQLVKTLVDKEMNPGVYLKQWDSRNNSGNLVASGVYFYRLVAKDFTQTKKLVVLK